MRTWRRRKETLGVFSLYAERYKSVYISVINNTNLNLFQILSKYIIWDRLSQKTISRYCPKNRIAAWRADMKTLLTYQPTWQAESIFWNRFLGSLNVYKFGLWDLLTSANLGSPHYTYVQSPCLLCITTSMPECYWSEKSSLSFTRNGDEEKSSIPNTQLFNIF